MLVSALVGFAGCGDSEPLALHDIQGPGDASPFAGSRVRVQDVVVTAVGNRGFFLQQPDGSVDGNPETSEGIYVYGTPPAGLESGEILDLEGRVHEFHGHTQLVEVSGVRRRGTTVPPSPVRLEDLDPADLERFESMRVSLPDALVAAPTNEHGIVEVVTGGRRPLRLKETPDLRPTLAMDPSGLGGGNQQLSAPRRFSAAGVLVYRFGRYVFWPVETDFGPAPELPRPVRPGRNGELVVAGYNLRLFVDERRDDGERAVGREEFTRRLRKQALWLDDVLQCPDVVAVQEVEVPEALERLAATSGCDYGAAHAGRADDLALGYLLGPAVEVRGAVREVLADRVLPGNDTPLFDRPPLVLTIDHAGRDLVLVNVHLRSMRGLGSNPRVALKRREQADAINALVRDLENRVGGRVLVLGDFNALPFDDGHADVLRRVAGDGHSRVLSAIWPRLPIEERYSYLYRGHAQMLDHAFAGHGLVERIREVRFARGNVDAPLANREDPGSALRASDHDPLVIYLGFPP